jgi:hypothetical protein
VDVLQLHGSRILFVDQLGLGDGGTTAEQRGTGHGNDLDEATAGSHSSGSLV